MKFSLYKPQDLLKSQTNEKMKSCTKYQFLIFKLCENKHFNARPHNYILVFVYLLSGWHFLILSVLDSKL